MAFDTRIEGGGIDMFAPCGRGAVHEQTAACPGQPAATMERSAAIMCTWRLRVPIMLTMLMVHGAKKVRPT